MQLKVLLPGAVASGPCFISQSRSRAARIWDLWLLTSCFQQIFALTGIFLPSRHVSLAEFMRPSHMWGALGPPSILLTQCSGMQNCLKNSSAGALLLISKLWKLQQAELDPEHHPVRDVAVRWGMGRGFRQHPCDPIITLQFLKSSPEPQVRKHLCCLGPSWNSFSLSLHAADVDFLNKSRSGWTRQTGHGLLLISHQQGYKSYNICPTWSTPLSRNAVMVYQAEVHFCMGCRRDFVQHTLQTEVATLLSSML